MNEKDLQKIAEQQMNEARRAPKDFTIAEIAKKEIYALKAEQGKRTAPFRDSAEEFIRRYQPNLSGYDSQTLKLIQVQSAGMARVARDYRQNDIAKRLEELHDSATEYMCGGE